MRGFTLLELLVTLAIVGLLAALAIPGYAHLVNRALRQDARLSLLGVQHRLEVAFANHLAYRLPAESPSGTPLGRSELGHYLIEVRIAPDGMSYTALASVDPGGRQASDTRCARFAVDETGHRRSADASGSWHDDDPYRCWG